MNLKVYTKRKYEDNHLIQASIGKSIVIDSATTFYLCLEQACESHYTLDQKYDVLRNVFTQVLEQSILNCTIALVGVFSKLDYCIKEFNIPSSIANLIHDTRKELFSHNSNGNDITDEVLLNAFSHNLKATAYLVYYLCKKEEIPLSLKKYFPKADRKSTWGKFNEKVLRASVERWDEQTIWVTEAENGSTLQVGYGPSNIYLTRNGASSWSYLNDVLWVGATLHLVRIRMDERGLVCLPELIILEPDYLINVTSIASCFETYAESPFLHLVNKLKPPPNSLPIHLGNLSGHLLDVLVHGKEVSYEACVRKFIKQQALHLLACPDFDEGLERLVDEGKIQAQNIHHLINHDLPTSVKEYDSRAVVLEPSFFSSTLGIQGRFDFLDEEADRVIIIEQKSGKGEFQPCSASQYDPARPLPKEPHVVQALLYRALYQYELNKVEALRITPMLLYSKYAKGLLELPPMPSLLLRAIRMRNLLAWSEYLYAKEGFDILLSLTPDNLNKKHVTGRLWEDYTKPALYQLLSPIHQTTPLERAYYLRFLRFIANEHLLSKVGNKMKDHSGFASVWHDTVEEKRLAGTIYDQLQVEECGSEGDTVVSVTLRFHETQTSDNTNFRIGDIVILYPYPQGDVPDACAQMVHRASIVDIHPDNIVLRLRNSQTDQRVFTALPAHMRWAIEHDGIDASTSSLYAAMHSFLSAPTPRRDLFLSQRLPETDESKTLKGDYGSFNTLSLRAKQAKELFLIIGPPGTGKTSYGLVNLLQEELLEEGGQVLLLSYTNRAVDEICSKLLEMKAHDASFDFIRIGSDLSCATAYQNFLFSHRCADASSLDEIEEMIRNCRVFCATTATLQANMSLFALKHFTLAIVDESSQILEPHLIGLFSACHKGTPAIDKFVLIGDHKQLPAVVQQSPEESVVTEPILHTIHLSDCRLSLFERFLLQFKRPHGYDERFVYMLTKQGRMHRDIATFPNYAFYNNKLDIVPLRHQLLPVQCATSSNGIQQMLTSFRVVFIASQPIPDTLSIKTNSIEAEMIAATVQQIYVLNQESFRPDQTVGIIVPYRNQISMVRNAIDCLDIPVLHDITIDTVERYQGSQRDYIIYGFTIRQPQQLNFLTNNVFEEDGLIVDRKLNVAMTRARLHLIMVGNPTLLHENITFHKLLEYMQRQDAYIDVSAEDYCNGNFALPQVKDCIVSPHSHESDLFPSEVQQTFQALVVQPIQEDVRTSYPEVLLGNNREANLSLINYGSIPFSQPISFYSPYLQQTYTVSPLDQVQLYCHYLMPVVYSHAQSMFRLYSDELSSRIKDKENSVYMMDFGCGPATCGLAFYELFQEFRFSYTGVEPSVAMQGMANAFMQAVCGDHVTSLFVKSMDELTEVYWERIFATPHVCIFNFSNFFIHVNSGFTEHLANCIIHLMRKYPFNEYLFFIQHPQNNSSLRSFGVFKKIVSNYVVPIQLEHEPMSNPMCHDAKTNPLCHEVWKLTSQHELH